DIVAASVTTVGSFTSNTARVMWTDDSASGWSSGDIGNATPAGGQALDPASGTWTINAGGADITGTSDQFRYVWQTLTGNGSVVAHVTSQANTSTGAKTGPM